MSDAEILKKAIEEALERGWNMFGHRPLLESWDTHSNGGLTFLFLTLKDGLSWEYSSNDVIVNHRFSEKFWGIAGTTVYENTDLVRKIVNWQFHLGRLVLEREPLQYLRRFLEAPDA